MKRLIWLIICLPIVLTTAVYGQTTTSKTGLSLATYKLPTTKNSFTMGLLDYLVLLLIHWWVIWVALMIICFCNSTIFNEIMYCLLLLLRLRLCGFGFSDTCT